MSMLSQEAHAQSPQKIRLEHKLRCPREDQTGQTCARCLRAGAPCVTSNLRPLGRPARKITPGNSHGRKRRPQKAVRGQSGAADDETDMLYDIDPARTPINPFETEKHPRAGSHNVPSDGPGSFDANSPGLFGLDPAILLGLSGLSDNFPGFEMSDGQSPFGIPSLNGTHSPSPGDAESAYADVSHRSSSQSQYSRDKFSRLDSDSLRAVDPSEQLGKTMSSADAVQKLSVLITSLSKQLDRLQTTPWSVTLVNIVCAKQEQEAGKNPLGEVLQSTAEFVHVLQTIALKPPSTHQPDSGFQSLNSDPNTLSSPAAGMYCSGIASNLNNVLQPLRINSWPLGPIHTPESMTPPPSDHFKPDISDALVILTCYIHIIRIYNILCSRVCESLSEMSHQSISSLQAIPGLEVGGFPVQYGNLQIKILIQVIMHLLAHMEHLLGTSAEFRLDPARGSNDGLLSSSELTALLRMVMNQKDDKEGDGMDVGCISSLRENMTKIQQMLEQNPFL
ncbi:hypothetical protein N7519_006522 [Penicillium mononematosum]|uniref:uncharacterized protein n=1 Tax=Penicillium mononematosum TaxID=268346 RepID=UPI002548F6E2|nr:uncharacterized protein N7519_006522 [Penicillium mononematosum]KAJ6185221.1 hypothetical protein N7519_006522 [Penicillium mononematosum]